MNSRKPTAELEAEADRILREDRMKGGSSPDEIDLLQVRDRNRKERRQYTIAERNQIVFETQVSPEIRLNPEQLLIREEEKSFAEKVLLQTLSHFENDGPVKELILAVLLFDVEFRSSRGLAEATGMTLEMTEAAKARLKYFAQSDKVQAKVVSQK